MRARHFLALVTIAVMAAALVFVPTARADRVSRVSLGTELRARPERGPDAAGTALELALPVGLVSAGRRTAFVLRGGVVVPKDGAPLILPATIGARVAPLGWWIRPLLGADLGGYLVRVGHADEDMPAPAPWCWSARALAGAALSLGERTAVSLYADLMWVQTPREQSARAPLGTTVGVGLEISVSFAPRWRLVDMVLDGKNAPEGF